MVSMSLCTWEYTVSLWCLLLKLRLSFLLYGHIFALKINAIRENRVNMLVSSQQCTFLLW